jgi:5-formyltetrahydrofolate cyclo-ligase
LRLSTIYIIFQKWLKIINLHKPKRILVYLPLDIEVNINYLIKYLRRFTNIDIYVPYMIGKSFVPTKYRLPLKRKKFGIKEPNISSKRYQSISLDMIIVPIVGIDKAHKRVGFGAGMYDRFFEKLKNKPIVVFTQRVLCKTKKTITSSHDIKSDYTITK